jgi:hypothetical protein
MGRRYDHSVARPATASGELADEVAKAVPLEIYPISESAHP